MLEIENEITTSEEEKSEWVWICSVSLPKTVVLAKNSKASLRPPYPMS